MNELELKYGNQSASDNSFTRKARLLQSIVRFKMNEKPGIGPKENSKDAEGNPSYYGNMLNNGEITGKNFILPATFLYAQERVKNKKIKETIDSYRLFNNMLSSMPMCFNLFHGFIEIKNQYPESLNKMLKKAFKIYGIEIDEINEIRIEYVSDKYEDKSAMDAAIIYSYNGKKYIIAIETKYVEPLGSNKASNNDGKYKLAKSLNIFTNEGLDYINNGCTQIYRNFLLTEFVRLDENFTDSFSVILSPKGNTTTDKELKELRDYLLPEFHYKLIKYDLENFIEALKEDCPDEYREWLDKFYNRYLNFEEVEQLMNELAQK